MKPKRSMLTDRPNQWPNQIRLLLLLIAVIPLIACGLDTSPAEKLWPFAAPTPAPTPTPVQFVIGPSSATEGLSDFSSYRANLILEFDGSLKGEPVAGKLESLVEVRQQPPARRLYQRTELITPTTALASGAADFFETEEILAAKKPGEEDWLAFNAGAARENWPSPAELGLSQPDELILLPPTVTTPPRIETLNGWSTEHYLFSEADLPPSNIVVDRAEGELWLAKPGNFLIQYVISASVRLQPPLSAPHLFDEGRLTLRYALTDINQELAITPPDFDTILARNELAQLPRLPDARIVAIFPTLLEYTSVISPISATLFYRDQLADLAWTENSADIFEEKARLHYAKEGQTVTVLINPGDTPDRVRVILDLKN